jgi:ribosomal protein S3AE
MSTIKERLTEVIQQQPDDATFEEILRELAFERMVQKGLKDAQTGDTISNEAMKQRIEQWQG